METQKRPPRTYGIANVTVSVLVFYLVASLFTAKCLYRWTTKLPVSKASTEMRAVAEKHWRRTARWGLEEPEMTLETAFLKAQDAHPLLYPKTYAQMVAKKKAKAQRKAKALPADDQRNGEVDEAAGIEAAAGPKVLVLGDSIMMSVGPVIKKDVTAKLAGAAVVKAKLATGLARPDVYDWVKELKRVTRSHHFDHVVMMLGTNDSQDFTVNGEILTYGTTEWVKVYTRRLADLMDVACSGADHGIWIGLPPMRSDTFNRKALRINSWAKAQVAKHPCMEYVSLDRVIGDEQGRYTSYLKIDDRLEKVRMVDGIHVTAQGGTLISASLLETFSTFSAASAH